jgi:hypothetical protein
MPITFHASPVIKRTTGNSHYFDEHQNNEVVLGTFSGLVHAAGTYKIVTSAYSANYKLFINGNGVLELRVANKAGLDYEGPSAVQSITIDSGTGAARDALSLAMNVENINEMPTGIRLRLPGTQNDVTEVTVDENVAVGRLGSLRLLDPDDGDWGRLGARWQIDPTSQYAGLFDIEPVTVSGSTTYHLRVIGTIDYEALPTQGVGQNRWIDLPIIGTDNLGNGNAFTQSIRIIVRDVAETPTNTPPTNVRFKSNNLDNISVNENTTAVGEVTADDVNTGDTLTYSFFGGNNPNANLFNITDAGVISLKNGVNYESLVGNKYYNVIVNVFDGANNVQKSLRVNIADVNEVASNVAFSNGQTVQAGATGANVDVVLATAADPDTIAAYQNNKYRFATDGDGGGLFQINPDTGQITTTRAVTAADVGQKTLKIVAFDGTLVSATYDYVVNIQAAANTPPTNVRFKSNNLDNISIDENTTAVGQVTAEDADTLTYSFATTNNPNANLFNITDAGVITLRNGVNYESLVGNKYYDVIVNVSDGTSTTPKSLRIHINDVNEAATSIEFIGGGQPIQAGQTGANVLVADANAVDPDSASSGFTNNRFRFANNSQVDGKYTIDAVTGEIRTNAAITANDVGPKTVEVVVYDATNDNLRRQDSYTFNVAAAEVSAWSIVAKDAVKNEGDTGTTAFVFTITRTNASEAGSITWNAVGSGTSPATADDFAVMTQTVSFAAGETSKDITIFVNGDKVVEANEAFNVNLSGASNGTISNGTATGVINNDDAAPGTPVFAITPANAITAEGNSGTTAFTFTVTRSSNSGLSSVEWEINGTGANPAESMDFRVTAGTVVFADGETAKTITVEVNGDTAVEGDEMFSVVLKNPQNGTIGTLGSAAGTIVDDDVTVVNNRPQNPVVMTKIVVAEGAAVNTEVAKILAPDPDLNDPVTYSIINPDGRFYIDPNTGILKVADGVRLDYEQAQSYAVTVRASDRSGAVSDNVTFNFSIADVQRENLTGTLGADVIKGGKDKDIFNGSAGDDRLWGGSGNDTLTGGSGKDAFVFDAKLGTSKTDRKVNFDTIKDYSVKDDSLWFENNLFKSNKTLYKAIKKGTELKPTKLASKFFTVGDKAKDSDDYFIYDSKKRVLSYDADGSGSKAAIEIASFTNNKALKNFKAGELFFI